MHKVSTPPSVEAGSGGFWLPLLEGGFIMYAVITVFEWAAS